MNGSTPEVRAYRWVICALSFAVLFVSQGLNFGGMAVFDVELMQAMSASAGGDVTVAQIKARDLIMLLTAAVLGIGSGWLADKVGVKSLLLTGLGLQAALNVLLARMQSLPELYWISVGLGLVLALCGLMAERLPDIELVRPQSRAGDRHRAGRHQHRQCVLPEGQHVADRGRRLAAGLRMAGLGTADPAAYRLLFDKERADERRQARRRRGPHQTDRLYARRRAVEPQLLVPRDGRDVHVLLDPRHAGERVHLYEQGGLSRDGRGDGVSILFIGGLFGKLLAGYLAETFGRKLILLTSLGLMLGGSVFLLLAIKLNSAFSLWAGLVGFGFGWGGIYTLIQLLAADLFGMIALGKILAAINILDAAGGAAGPFVTGLLFDMTGSYFVSFAVMTGLLCVATLAASLLDMQKAAIHAAN